ncbi:MAG: hypothetical protein Q8921_14590 [Bacteroidota bacterium]|nr:hypothetical protein [Bacteroidota bacterium]
MGTTLFAGSYGAGVLRSLDSGASWSAVDSGLRYSDVTILGVIGSRIIACSDSGGGVFMSSDSGASWEDIGIGLPDTSIIALALVGNDFVVSTGRLLWTRPLSQVIPQSAVPQSSVTKFAFHAFPNPFTTSTTISFTPVASGYADISIVNLLGVEVARILSGELTAAEHTFMWNPAGLSDWMYECLIRMNGQVEKLPVMLLR